jgi:two-component system, chemotaxis family, protein-glutamate methylesterase/glutaminase
MLTDTQRIKLQTTSRPVKRVLIAEDSATIRHHLISLINETPGIEVVGQARNGEEAIRLTAELRPDVVSMDIRMPIIDGLEATRRIMANTPKPVVVVSGLVERDVALSVRALDAGALAVVEKPPYRTHPDFEAKHVQLVKTLIAMSSVSVVRRGGGPLVPPQPTIAAPAPQDAQLEVIGIGASAGGPSALSKVLGAFPADFPVPIVVVQHIPSEFIAGLARWLSQTTPLTVKVAQDYGVLRPGVVHLAPGDYHTHVIRSGGRLVTRLIAAKGEHHHQPAVDELFYSLAAQCGRHAVGIILTGMGTDGAQGLLAMKQAGAVTLAQDQASATVYGMPGAAVAQGAVKQIVSLAELPTAILKLM